MKLYTQCIRPLIIASGFLSALVGCGGGDQGRAPILGLDAATLLSVSVTPASASIAAGLGQQYIATATYSDNSTMDVSTQTAWSSSTPAVATINATTAAATSLTAGTTTISASYKGKSGTATLTVLPPALLSLVVTPTTSSVAVGATQSFTAAGTYTDRSTRDITATTVFTSSKTGVASIATGTNIATGLSAGASVITATSGALSATATLNVTGATLASLAISPQNLVLQAGATQQLALIATYSDGSTANVSSTGAFTSNNSGVATSTNGGLIAGVATGSSIVTATFGGMSVTTSVTVPAGVTLSSIVVTPASTTVAIGGTQQFIATANYSDNSSALVTNTATWSSSAGAIASINAGGLALGAAAGSATITATSGGRSGSAVLTVSAAVPVPPIVASVNLGSAASFGVLAGTSITNNSGGTTLITGDVGSPSQTTDPTQVAGYTNYKSGAILAGALADLQTAITDANGRTCDVNFAGGIDLGGQTLAPGVYCYSGAISITGTLTLSGPGVYIFRTALTLNTTANSIVALASGATATNVSWLPVGPSTLGANSVFKGSILGQSAAITVGDNATLLNGRVLTAAAVTLRNNQIAK